MQVQVGLGGQKGSEQFLGLTMTSDPQSQKPITKSDPQPDYFQSPELVIPISGVTSGATLAHRTEHRLQFLPRFRCDGITRVELIPQIGR